MKAQIKDKREIADQTLQVTFDLLGNKVNFKSGQYFFIALPKLYYPDSRGNRRHFSIINSPNENSILTFATRMRDSSGFKKTIKEMEIGSEVEVGPIDGSFVLPDDTKRPLFFIAGGIGITPFMSMLYSIQENKLPFDVTLIYSNKNEYSAVYLEELKKISQANPNIKLVLTMTEDDSWEGEKRKIDSQFIRDYTNGLDNPLYYVVGPPPMVEIIVKALNEAGIKQGDIKIENFTGY